VSVPREATIKERATQLALEELGLTRRPAILFFMICCPRGAFDLNLHESEYLAT
jgi:hypothetical protein